MLRKWLRWWRVGRRESALEKIAVKVRAEQERLSSTRVGLVTAISELSIQLSDAKKLHDKMDKLGGIL
jgi:hypothetical protein